MDRLFKIVPIVARVLMGLLFTFSGINGLFGLIPPPADGMPVAAMELSKAMMESGYMMKLVFLTQLLGGLGLLTGFFVPLALALLAPVVVNIFTFHLFLAPAGIGMAVFVCLIEIYLAWHFRSSFAPMLRAKP